MFQLHQLSEVQWDMSEVPFVRTMDYLYSASHLDILR